MENLCEICIHVDHTVEVDQLIPFLQSVPEEITLKFIGNMEKVTRYKELLSFLDQHAWPKYIVCAYTDMIALQPALGNIYTHSIYEIVCKEIEKGLSWFRIRNEAPCNECVYRWLCPSPSDYETAIGRPDLCHVHNNKKDNYCNHQK